MERIGKLVASRWFLVAVLLLASIAVGSAWALSSPIGSSPDDDFHLPSIWCSATAPGHLCRDLGPSDRDGYRSVEVPAALGPNVACYRYQMFQSAACQTSPSDSRIVTTANGDLYPGGYYDLLGFFASGHVVQSVVVMRLVNFVLCVAMVGSAMCFARPSLRRSSVVALGATFVPMTSFLWSSTNPSGVVVASVASVWILLRSLADDQSRRRAIIGWSLLVVCALLGLVSRSDAGLFLLIAAGSVLLLQPRDRVVRLLRQRIVVVVALLALLSIALAFASRFPDSGPLVGMQKVDYDRGFGEVFFYNFVNIPLMWTGALGAQGLGWLDTPMPVFVPFIMVSLVVVLVLVGLATGTRAVARATFVVIALLIVVPYYVMATDRSLVGEIFQSRYLLPLLPVLVMCALSSNRRVAEGSIPRSLWTSGWVAVGLANSIAIHANIRRYTTGVEYRTWNLDSPREWWWNWGPSPLATWIIGSLGFLVVGVATSRLLAVTEGELAVQGGYLPTDQLMK